MLMNQLSKKDKIAFLKWQFPLRQISDFGNTGLTQNYGIEYSGLVFKDQFEKIETIGFRVEYVKPVTDQKTILVISERN